MQLTTLRIDFINISKKHCEAIKCQGILYKDWLGLFLGLSLIPQDICFYYGDVLNSKFVMGFYVPKMLCQQEVNDCK